MGRNASFNPEMAALGEVIAKYMGNRTVIRARYAAMAEKEIADQRVEIQRRMLTEFPDAGPSEFANSTGLSRSTVIRWLEEAKSRHLNLGDENVVQVNPGTGMAFGAEDYNGSRVAYIVHGGKRLYLLMGDTFGYGETAEQADQPGNLITAPEWLTEDLMREAVESTGATLLYAPWNARALTPKKEKS